MVISLRACKSKVICRFEPDTFETFDHGNKLFFCKYVILNEFR